MPERETEQLCLCPECGEEFWASLQPGFNKVDCPYCTFYLIVYLDDEAQCWTRLPGVLQSQST